MEKKIGLRVGLAFAALGAGTLAVSGCGLFEKNYEGEGNEFIIRGPVLDVGDDSVKILPLEIVDADGKAKNWFHTDDETRVHDNYKNGWCNQKEVGDVYDVNGLEEDLDDLQEGEWVEIHGKIRESKVHCGKHPRWNWRPVFDSVQEINE